MSLATTYDGTTLPGLQRSKSTAFADRPGSEVKPRSNCTAQRNKLPPLRSESGTAPERSAHSWPAGTLRRPSMFAAQGSVCPGMRPTECAPIMFQCHAHGSSSGLDGGLAATTNMPGEGTTSPERVAELCRGVASMALWEEQDPGRMDDVCRTEAALGTPLAPRVPALPGCDQGPQSPQGSLACCTAAAQDCQALEDFSSLRIIATSRGSTVWEGTPKAAAGRAPACSVVLKAVCAAQLGRRALQQLLLEQRVLGTVRHPNIIKGLGSFQQEGHTFLVMEHADGRSLPQFLSYWRWRNKEDFEHGSDTTLVPEADAAHLVLAPVLDALGHLHASGIVHRDVKAGNLVFTRAGCLKLLDFGLSLDMHDGEEPPRGQVGTPPYMAPELVGDAAPSPALVDRTDVWSVGALAFQLLTGQLPWSHDVPAPLRHMVAEAAVPWELLDVMGASPAAKYFIGQALTKDAAQRPTARQLRAHPWLLAHAGGQPLEPTRFAA